MLATPVLRRSSQPRCTVTIGAVAVVVVLATLAGCRAPEASPRPLVLAHRGASHHLPQHSLAAYAFAYAQGADYLEPDVVLTRDGELVCSHDLAVSAQSDAAERWPDRLDGEGRVPIADLDLHELRQVRLVDGREPSLGEHGYVTLEELLQLVRRLDATTGRRVGVIVEPKSPEQHAERGLPIEEPLLALLDRYGYRDTDDPAIVQCFDAASLQRLRALGCELQLFLLTSETPTSEELDQLATVVDGLGVERTLIEDDDGRPVNGGALVHEAHARGLAIYAWTFVDDIDAMRRFFDVYGVDGLFTDDPGRGLVARDGG